MDEKKDMTVERASSPQETVLDLKAVRETRGLSLQAIFETTRVGLVHLTAVENGDYRRRDHRRLKSTPLIAIPCRKPSNAT